MQTFTPREIFDDALESLLKDERRKANEELEAFKAQANRTLFQLKNEIMQLQRQLREKNE